VTLSIRARLTLWYTLVLTVVLGAFAGGFYLLHARSRVARLDDELERSAALVARLVPEELQEGAALEEAAHEALEDIVLPGRMLAIFDPGGERLAGRWDGLPLEGPSALGEGGRVSETVETPGGKVRVFRSRYRHADTVYQIGVAEPLTTVESELAALRRALLGSLLFALLLAAAGGWWIARAALRPVELMAARARRVTERTPGFRLDAPNPKDELGLLANAFNDLLARLETALSQQRQFMADASHELRTPVSIGRTAIEVTLARTGRAEEEYRDSLRVVAEQMRRLSRLVDDMFTLARADAAGLPLDRASLYLDELVADCVKEAAVLAQSKGVDLKVSGPSDLELRGDEGRLRDMLMNLLDNAIRHTPSGGRVRVELTARPDALEVAVTDSGEGIPEAEHERVFQRFVRLDASRRPGEGAGLGLPIARAIAEAHGGTLVLARSDASGTRFVVTLPLPAAATRS
jgi:heavy metal sensor kinase